MPQLELTDFELKALDDLVAGHSGNIQSGDEQFDRAIQRIHMKLVKAREGIKK